MTSARRSLPSFCPASIVSQPETSVVVPGRRRWSSVSGPKAACQHPQAPQRRPARAAAIARTHGIGRAGCQSSSQRRTRRRNPIVVAENPASEVVAAAKFPGRSPGDAEGIERHRAGADRGQRPRHVRNGFRADARLVSLGESGLGVRRRFPETLKRRSLPAAMARFSPRRRPSPSPPLPGFDASRPAAVRGCGCRSRAGRLSVLERRRDRQRPGRARPGRRAGGGGASESLVTPAATHGSRSISSRAGAGRFEKPAPDARAAPPEAHESLISRKTGAEVPLTGLSFGAHGPHGGAADPRRPA